MPKVKTTIYVDEDVLRQVRVAAARQGKRDSEIIEAALRSRTIGGILDSIHQDRHEQGIEPLGEEEALELAYRELKAMRTERDRSGA